MYLLDPSLLLYILQSSDLSVAFRAVERAPENQKRSVFVRIAVGLINMNDTRKSTWWERVAKEVFAPSMILRRFWRNLGAVEAVRESVSGVPVGENDRVACDDGCVQEILELWDSVYYRVPIQELVPTEWMPKKIFRDFQFFPWAKYVASSQRGSYVSPVRGLLGGEEDDSFE